MIQRISKAQVIVSILAMLNVVFVPIFDVWGGLFPGNPDDNFFDVMECLFSGDGWSMNVFIFTIAIFIPSALMLVFSVFGLKIPAKISAIGGIVWLGVCLIRFVDEYGISYLYDFDDGNISIGLWIGLLLFIVMALVRVKKKISD